MAARVRVLRYREIKQGEFAMTTQNILVETKGRVGIIRFNRPQALNALNAALVAELNAALDAFESDDNIGCIVITGSDKAFAAGADIKEMVDRSYMEMMPRISPPIMIASRGPASRSSPRSRALRSAAAASSPCNAI